MNLLREFFSIRNICKDKNIQDSAIDPKESKPATALQPIIAASELVKIANSLEDPSANVPPGTPGKNGSRQFKFQTIAAKEVPKPIENIPIMDLTGKEVKMARQETKPCLVSDLQNCKCEPRHEEHQYLDLIRDILARGYRESGRNGATVVKFGHSMRFSLRDGTIPILTTKRLAWRVCFEELFWFIRGSTSNHDLIAKNVHIWDANASREFLDSRGLHFLDENDLGPIYGFQWRHFNAEYTNCHQCYVGSGIDQLAEIIECLRDPAARSSRRLIMTAWNPCQLASMALPPCHVMAQFHVREGKYLSCALYQRSGDVGLGVPFNIASYALLTHLLAKHCDLEAEEFVHFLGNCHIYEQHIEPLKTQLVREPKEFPRIRIATKHADIEDYNLEDIVWETKYECWDGIKMAMSP